MRDLGQITGLGSRRKNTRVMGREKQNKTKLRSSASPWYNYIVYLLESALTSLPVFSQTAVHHLKFLPADWVPVESCRRRLFYLLNLRRTGRGPAFEVAVAGGREEDGGGLGRFRGEGSGGGVGVDEADAD